MTPKNNPPILEDSRGALLMPPTPPEAGTIRVLIPRGFTWSTRDVPGAVQLDITLVTPLAPSLKGGRR